jgi:hypothetical protein
MKHCDLFLKGQSKCNQEIQNLSHFVGFYCNKFLKTKIILTEGTSRWIWSTSFLWMLSQISADCDEVWTFKAFYISNQLSHRDEDRSCFQIFYHQYQCSEEVGIFQNLLFLKYLSRSAIFMMIFTEISTRDDYNLKTHESIIANSWSILT